MPFSGQHLKSLGFLLVACALLLSGCAAMYGLKEDPKISIADIRIQEVKAMEGIFLIKLRVLNPNDVPLDLHGINCDLEINQRHFANGIGDSNQTVPPPAGDGSHRCPRIQAGSALQILGRIVPQRTGPATLKPTQSR